ncbi:MAG TPA: exodeoxyribonuclease VII large subunit [Bacteroidales bacterium]|nr:exodeoxyribonuclease VII large subunit [Bacteroidales bacterium]
MTEKLTLSELQLIIRDSLYMSFPDMYWVIAEISEIKENYAGHCYLELIEKQKDENIRARVKGIIWCKRYGFLKSYFENITGESLREGLKVLVRVKIEYHELYGLSLVICDIDPSFTLGELAMKRQLIIRQLEQEGIFSMNKELGLPISLQRIAIISSSSAAGYTDFMDHLINNDFGYVFYTKLFESPMQGSDTEKGVINALDRIAANQDLFDVVVLIRGGGSQVDLSWFDNYNIAYHITQFPLPVLTGIGHEKDMSVSDMVAFAALKTPTAVADFIVNHMSSIGSRLNEMITEIKDLSREILETNHKRLETSGIRLLPLSRLFISGTRDLLSEKSFRLITSGGEYIRKAQLIPAGQNSRLLTGLKTFFTSGYSKLERFMPDLHAHSLGMLQKRILKLETYDKNIDLLKPENVLKRGYTMTYRNGSIMKRKEGLEQGDIIDTRFSDGIISSRIIEDDQRS